MFEEFFSRGDVKTLTMAVPVVLLLVIGIAYLVVPFRLQGDQRTAFRKISYQIYGQLIVMFVLMSVQLFAGAKTRDFSFVIGDALPGLAFLAALAVLWDARTTRVDIKEATIRHGSNQKLQLLAITNRAVCVVALLSLLAAGAILVVQYFKILVPTPTWMWFVSFVITGPAICCMALSKSVSYFAGRWNR